MAESIFSGAKTFEYDDAGNAFAAAVELSPCKSDSESNPEMPEDDETTEGQQLFAGEYKNEVIRVYDISKYAALRTKMVNDERIDLRQTDLGDNTNIIAENFIPRVQKPNQYQPGQRRFFELMVRKFVTK